MLGLGLTDTSHAREVQLNHQGCINFAQLILALQEERDAGRSQADQLKEMTSLGLEKDVAAVARRMILLPHVNGGGRQLAQEFYDFCVKNQGRVQVVDESDG